MSILKPIILTLIVLSLISILVFQQDGLDYQYLSFSELIRIFQENLKFDVEGLLSSFDDVTDTVSDIGELFSRSFPASEMNWWNVMFPVTQIGNVVTFLLDSLPSLFRLIVTFLRLLFFLLQDGVKVIDAVLGTLDAVFHPATKVPNLFGPA